MSHGARERTPADRDHCGRHKIVIIAAGTIRPTSFATAFWKQEPFVDSAGFDESVVQLSAKSPIDGVLNRVTEIPVRIHR
jgi:hypothetical protein